MKRIEKPLQLVDFKRGRISPNKVSAFSVPENSVSEALNVDFDTRIGSIVPRKGAIELFGLTSATHGAGIFKNSSGSTDIALFATDTKIKIWNGITAVDAAVTINSVNKVRFATLGNRVFFVNGIGMFSSADGNTWNQDDCITTAFPTLILRTKQHMICAGDATYPDRIFFSSVINPTVNPFITWNTTTFASAAGGWIDINPDDNSNITALQETSDTIIVFKEKTFYRVDTISKSVSATEIFNVGTLSQESTTRCYGMVYFYTGKQIMRTDGGYPEQISRVAVQDYLDVITDKTKVNMWSDYNNVYTSIGDITLKGKTLTNVVLKFNVLDESWTVYTYSRFMKDFVTYKDEIIGGATLSVSKLQTGFTDFGASIAFDVKTQHNFIQSINLKTITDKIAVISRYSEGTSIYCIINGLSSNEKRVDLQSNLADFVSVTIPSNLEFRTIAFGWCGTTNDGLGDTEPELIGIQVPEMMDLGLVKFK